MRDGWTETTLGDIASWSSGKNLGSDKRNELGLNPILGANGIIGRTNEVLLDEELITVGRVGACGETHRSSGPVWISDNALIVIPAEQVTIDLLFYVLSTFDYQSIISGTTQPLITQSKMKSQIVNLPPLAAQKRIVDVVSSVDAYIDALQQQADTARTARNAVLHELLSAGGDDWTESTLGDIAQWQGGITPSMANNEFWENGTIPWVSSGDVLQLNLRGAQKFVTEISLKETSLKLLPVGTVVVVVRSGILIHTLPIAILESPSTINQDIKAGVPRSDVLGQFLLWALRSNSRVILESCRKTGTTVQSISTDAFLKFPVLLPPLDEQKRIVEIVSFMDEVIQSTEQAVTDAKILRSGLLSDLLSGEHEIPDSYDSLLGAA